MALQHFVQQSTQKSSQPVLDTVVNSVPGKPEPVAQPSQSQLFGSSQQKKAATAESSEDNMMRAPVTLTPHDREVLSSLAAVQVRYNRPAEAVPYLMMLRKTDPSDHQAARLLALALMKLGNWEQAELILADINDMDDNDAATYSILTFYRGLVAFKQRKMSAARHWIKRFRALVTGGAA